MTPPNEQALLAKLRSLAATASGRSRGFHRVLGDQERTRALDRLLELAPALEAAGTEPMSEEAIVAEVKAARAARRSALEQRAENRR